jgi:serine carboxypeptidase 1
VGEPPLTAAPPKKTRRASLPPAARVPLTPRRARLPHAADKVTSDKCDAAVAAGDWAEAINQWGAAENVIEDLGDGVNFYNVVNQQDPVDNVRRRRELSAAARPATRLSAAALAHAAPGVDAATLSRLYDRHVRLLGSHRPELGAPLDDLMNGPVRAQLNAGPNGKVVPDSVTWGGQSSAVFSALSNDFMRPVVANVDALLADGRAQVIAFQGQLDLICCTTGTEAWIKNLTWPGLPAWQATKKVPAYAWPGGTAPTGGFVKRSGKFTLWLVNNAGHLLAGDNQLMGLYMLKDILASA